MERETHDEGVVVDESLEGGGRYPQKAERDGPTYGSRALDSTANSMDEQLLSTA